MKNKIARILIYTNLSGLFLWELLLLFGWLPEQSSTFIEIVSLGSFMFFYIQANVVISLLLLAVLIHRYKVKHAYSSRIPLILTLYFAASFIFSYGYVDGFREAHLKDVAVYYKNYRLSYAWAKPDNFFSNIYVLFKLGAYKISCVYDAMFNHIYHGNSDAADMVLPLFANTLLSFGTAVIAILSLTLAPLRPKPAGYSKPF